MNTQILATVNLPSGAYYHVENVASGHKLWSAFLDQQERFGSGRPVVSPYHRNRFEQALTDASVNPIDGDSFEAKLDRAELREAEQALAALDAASYLQEDFRGLRRSLWTPTEFSSATTDEELVIARDESLREMGEIISWFRVSRTELVNRCALAKRGRIERFSFGAAWGDWKQAARENGADLRAARSFAKACERELSRREWAREMERREIVASEARYCTSTGEMQESGAGDDGEDMEYMFPADYNGEYLTANLGEMVKQAKAQAGLSKARKALLAKRAQRSWQEQKAIEAQRSAAIERFAHWKAQQA